VAPPKPAAGAAPRAQRSRAAARRLAAAAAAAGGTARVALAPAAPGARGALLPAPRLALAIAADLLHTTSARAASGGGAGGSYRSAEGEPSRALPPAELLASPLGALGRWASSAEGAVANVAPAKSQKQLGVLGGEDGGALARPLLLEADGGSEGAGDGAPRERAPPHALAAARGAALRALLPSTSIRALTREWFVAPAEIIALALVELGSGAGEGAGGGGAGGGSAGGGSAGGGSAGGGAAAAPPPLAIAPGPLLTLPDRLFGTLLDALDISLRAEEEEEGVYASRAGGAKAALAARLFPRVAVSAVDAAAARPGADAPSPLTAAAQNCVVQTVKDVLLAAAAAAAGVLAPGAALAPFTAHAAPRARRALRTLAERRLRVSRLPALGEGASSTADAGAFTPSTLLAEPLAVALAAAAAACAANSAATDDGAAAAALALRRAAAAAGAMRRDVLEA
jgi:hypothetical protein